MIWVKICGVTGVEDALGCAQAGADAVGLNFYPGSPRYCRPETARAIVDAVAGRATTVGVFVDAGYQEILDLRERVGFDLAQLHGSEPPELLRRLLPRAFKALRLRGASEDDRDAALREAMVFGGDFILLDAFVAGLPGGTGRSCDWGLSARIARERRVVLAGGLSPHNVAEALARVAPFGVDACSGVERSPGVKDLSLVSAFVHAAKA